MPARRKFLKSAVTEASHVARWLERIALVRPDVRFELERDGRRSLLWLPTADPRERLIAVLSPGTGERLLPIDAEHAGLSAARLRESDRRDAQRARASCTST